MEPGEGISGSSSIPIGQVIFVPREEVIMRECTQDEIAGIKTSRQEFAHHKATVRLTTPYGLTYSPHYLRESRSRKDADKGVASSIPEQMQEKPEETPQS
jgi:hypothetical protein